MYRKWKPSKSARIEFANKMADIDSFCTENGIHRSRSSDSYYFELNGVNYRVSNHTVEKSNASASVVLDTGEVIEIRDQYHPSGREPDTVYIHASKTRIMEIYNDLLHGYVLDGRGYRVI